MIDISSFEKIKHQNALVIFFLIVVCFLFPYLILFFSNPTFLYKEDFLKTIILVIATGAINVTYYYIIVIIFSQMSYGIDFYITKPNSFSEDTSNKYRLPLLYSILGLSLSYFLILYRIIFDDLKGLKDIIKSFISISLSTSILLSGLVNSISEIIIRIFENTYFFLKRKLKKKS